MTRLILIGLCLLWGVEALRLASYHIPAVVDFREELALSCQFDTEGRSFHSIRWLINGTEFYRYGPTLRPVKAFHYVDGISVQIEKSNKTTVVLSPLYFTTSGEFTCEATTSPPLYRKLSVSNNIIVVALPKEGPSIQGIRPNHSWGDELALNCTSSPSYPAADLIWAIGGTPVPKDWTEEFTLDDGLRIQSTKKGLRLHTDTLPFDETGEVTVSCTAYVPGIYSNMATLHLAKAVKV